MQPFKKVDFYFVAHADDWQLFMDPEIGRNIADKSCKVVIVHTTAGDAGLDEHYWKARERAALESILFRVSADEGLDRSGQEWEDSAKRPHTPITINNCSCYFLRLPDGAYDGHGFAAYGNQSLDKLRTGSIMEMASVDRRSVYMSWKDLIRTIDDIVEKELSACSIDRSQNVCLNFPEYDAVLSPFDHNDHFNTSLLVLGTEAYTCYKRQAFVHYHIKNNDRLLSGEELFWKIGMFSTYHQSLFREYGHSTLLEDESFIPWCFRDSSRREI